MKNNALSHALLAKSIKFRDEEEQKEFNELLNNLELDFQHAIQHMMQQELAKCWWKSQMAERELGDIRSRQNASTQMMSKLISLIQEGGSDLSDIHGHEIPAAVDLSGWNGRELVLKAGKSITDASVIADENGSPVIELRLDSSMETILRYQASLKRDFYRALQTLMNLERDRYVQPVTYVSNNDSED